MDCLGRVRSRTGLGKKGAGSLQQGQPGSVEPGGSEDSIHCLGRIVQVLQCLSCPSFRPPPTSLGKLFLSLTHLGYPSNVPCSLTPSDSREGCPLIAHLRWSLVRMVLLFLPGVSPVPGVLTCGLHRVPCRRFAPIPRRPIPAGQGETIR